MVTMTIERFEREYIEFHGISTGRAVEQVNVLRQFEEHAGKPLADCRADDLRSYMAALLDSGLHVNTVAKKAHMIRPYFGWAFDAGLIDGDALMQVQRVKNPRGATNGSKPKPYSAKELRAFWSDLDKTWPHTTDLKLKRWRNGTSPYRSVWTHATRLQIEAIVRLALDCGLRRQEIYAAQIDDIHPDNFYVVVTNGKRVASREDKPREVPFTKQARIAVDAWLNFRLEVLRFHKVEDHGSVWLGCRNPRPAKPIRWRRFQTIVGTCGPYTLHRFRHTCATNWLRAGVELEVVSRMLGHSNLQQTLGYAALVRDDIHHAVHKHEEVFERLANGGDGGDILAARDDHDTA